MSGLYLTVHSVEVKKIIHCFLLYFLVAYIQLNLVILYVGWYNLMEYFNIFDMILEFMIYTLH